MSAVAYYPGCALKSIDLAYDVSSVAVCRELGLALEEIRGYNCCGIGELKSDGDVAYVLPTRILALAEGQNLGEVMAPCSVCYGELARAQSVLAQDAARRGRVNGMLRQAGERPYTREVKVRHLLEYLYREAGPEKVAARVRQPLKGLRVAPYYGCLYTRPGWFTQAGRDPALDNPERPHFMADLLGAVGATVVEHPNQVSCCGGRNVVQDEEATALLDYRILSGAKEEGAQVLALICPKCSGALDINQTKAIARHGEGARLPVVYLTQLLGLAFGLGRGQLRLGDMESGAAALLREAGFGH